MTDSESLAAREYLRRFEVEQAIQAAVNSAISHKADDPISHIADFLEKLGRQYESGEAGNTPRQMMRPAE